ncbi:MAG: ABC transporter permease, partial [Chloroflexi bacterium]|nr:ABC transporter permease [Chloroflexota bacterium]
RNSARAMTKAPGAEIAIILTIGLGIAASTAVFSVANSVLIRPLPFSDPDRLVVITATLRGGPFPISFPEFLDWQLQNRTFAHMAAFGNPIDFNLTSGFETQRIRVVAVTAEFWTVLGVPPFLGRGFLPEEDTPASPGVVVISHELWSRSFGSDRSILGRPITTTQRSYTVVGVMPPNVRYPLDADAWIPEGPSRILNRRVRGFEVLGRVKRNRPFQSAVADMAAIARRLEIDYPVSNRGFGVRLMLLRDRIVGNVRLLLVALSASVALVLLIACLNVASVVLARAVNRESEIAVRIALGATRARIVLQVISEGMLRVAAISIVGLIGGAWGAMLIGRLVEGHSSQPGGFCPDAAVVAFCILISGLIVLAIGCVPALRLSRIEAACVIHARSRGATNWRHSRVRTIATVAQVAISMTLVVASGLLLRSLLNIEAIHPGFNPDRLISFRVALPVVNREIRDAAYWLILDRLRSAPGVQGVAGTSEFPVGRRLIDMSFSIDGEPPVPPEKRKLADVGCITAGYASLMGIPLLGGREFAAQDRAPGAPIVATVNESFARRYFPSAEHSYSAVDQALIFQGVGKVRIVGVLGSVSREPIGAPPREEVYMSCEQLPRPWMTFAVRTAVDPLSMAPTIRQVVHSVDSRLPVFEVQTAEHALSRLLSQRRLYSVMLAILANFSLIVAAVGHYGAVAYWTRLRLGEMAIRMAVGAGRLDILALVAREGLLPASVGIVIGLALSLFFTRLLRTLLYGVSATDWPTFAMAAFFLSIVTLVATLIPACRATRIAPSHILGAE